MQISTKGGHKHKQSTIQTMKQFSILLVAVVCTIAGCQQQNEQPGIAPVNSVSDSTVLEIVDTLLTPATIRYLDSAGWTAILKRSQSTFEWSHFKMINTWKEDSMITSAFTADANFLKKEKRLLKFSPDQHFLLDLDNYAVAVQDNKNKGSRVSVRGPDTEVSLLDLQEKIKTRLLFMGPGASVEDGGWIDNENIVLLGMEERNNDGMKVPVIWKYHLPTKSFYLFEYPEPIRYNNQ